MGSIKPLPVAVLSAVRSGFIIGGLTTLVEELIYNSLDAGATKVSVYVGVNNGYVKVEDDGSGISRDGLVLLGERYATSKLHHFHDKDDGAGSFGFRGEVLCSIADISLIEIVTKVHGRANGYRKIMKGHKCLYLSIDNDRQDVGTTVIVRDLFYNQPVRRRQMQSSAKKVLHSVKECAVRIALVQPKVSFKIVDMESDDELLHTHTSSSPLPILCNNFGFEASSLHELSFSKGSLKLEGYVSGPSSSIPLKAIQYIYVNSRFIVKGSIHKVLNHLADTCWDQLSCDKGGKRGQPNQGPIYCLNLTCPRSSYELSLEFSRTTVEFKDWAPILMFIEQSVASLWSKSTKIGESSNCENDQIGNSVEEKIVGNMTSVQKDWWLRTCEISTKRRRVQSSEHEQTSVVSSPYSKEEMQVEDDSNLSLRQGIGQRRNTRRNAVKFGEPETKRAFCNQMDSSESGGASPSECNFDVKDSIDSHLWDPNKGIMSFNEAVLENDITTRKRERNYGEDYLSSSRLIDELRVDHANARSGEVGSGWSFELTQENHRYKAISDCKKLFLPDCSWGNLVQTPLDYDKNSIFEEDNFNAKRSCSNSTGSGYADGFSQTDTILRAQCQKGGGSCRPLPKFNMESDMWNDLDITSMKCCDSLSSYKEYIDREYTPESLSKQDRVCSSCFSVDTDQHSAISYPFLSMETCDFEHLICDGRFERSSKARSCDGFEESNDDKEFYSDDLGDRCCYKNYSSASCLNSTSLFRSDYAGVGKGVWEFSPCGQSINDITPVRYGDFPEETFSPCMDRRGRDYRSSPSACRSASDREVKMDVQRYQALEAEHISGKRLGRTHHPCSPDGRRSGRCDDTFTDETFSPCLDLKRKLNTHGLSVRCVSPISVDERPEIDFQRCQVPEPNCSFPEQSVICCTRLRRSHSAPPLYRGKRRFVSVMNCLLSTVESPAVQTTSQVCNMTEKGEMEHPPGWPLFYSEHVQHHETICTEDSLFCIDLDVKETSNIPQLSTWAQDDITESACCGSGYLKQVQDSESSLTKWREGFPEDIAKNLKVGDRFNQVEDENTVLDIHSCMLLIAGDSLVPKSIDRTCLESAKVLLQVDNKFIPVVASGTLAVIDQHAADERIRLEEMRRKVLSGEMKSRTYLQEEKDLVLPEMAYQLLCNYSEHIQHWGWICNIFSQDSGSFAKNLNLLNPQPNQLTLLAVPCILGVNLSDADLLEFLEQLAETDGSSTIPPSVLRILNYKACRGAIMFGDMLLPSECSLIVEELKRTSLCFQCAHGRPTTAPLVNLKALRKGITQLQSWHEGSNHSWHGLCRKEINIRRAKHRLDKARGCG